LQHPISALTITAVYAVLPNFNQKEILMDLLPIVNETLDGVNQIAVIPGFEEVTSIYGVIVAIYLIYKVL
jgi:hypothetical protein